MPSTVGAPLRLGVIIAYRLDNRPSYADLPPTAHTPSFLGSTLENAQKLHFGLLRLPNMASCYISVSQ